MNSGLSHFRRLCRGLPPNQPVSPPLAPLPTGRAKKLGTKIFRKHGFGERGVKGGGGGGGRKMYTHIHKTPP